MRSGRTRQGCRLDRRHVFFLFRRGGRDAVTRPCEDRDGTDDAELRGRKTVDGSRFRAQAGRHHPARRPTWSNVTRRFSASRGSRGSKRTAWAGVWAPAARASSTSASGRGRTSSPCRSPSKFSRRRDMTTKSLRRGMARMAQVAIRVAQIQQDNLIDVHNFIGMTASVCGNGVGRRLRHPETSSRVDAQAGPAGSPRRWDSINDVIVTAGRSIRGSSRAWRSPSCAPPARVRVASRGDRPR